MVVAEECTVELQAPWAAEAAGREWQKAFMVVAEECTLQNLRPGSSYRVRVSALNCCGAGPTSPAADCHTLSSVPAGPP
eukprot:607199-Prorocentrum_minimum.AAC.1